ncbi:MAG TPA: DUF3761 domain-containing protein [Pseudonocardiaceae bacterium]|jgi:hypothetical protein|nr:DUF3761 domain-containing protein [Pseudonocardiaceae bacterium]
MKTIRPIIGAIAALFLIGGIASACDPNTSPPSQPAGTIATSATTSATTDAPTTTPAPVTTVPATTIPAPPPVTEAPQQPVTQAAPPPAQPDCGSDSYLNSDGQCVHDPVAADSPPVGATAKCNDGTYSFSKHHSGTCSGHHGVAEWL